MGYRLFYSSYCENHNGIFVSKNLKSFNGDTDEEDLEERILSEKSFVTTEEKDVLKHADNFLSYSSIPIFAATNLQSGPKIVLSDNNTLGLVDPRLTRIKRTEIGRGKECKTESVTDDYIRLLVIFEKLMTGEIAVTPDKWPDLVEIVKFINDGLSKGEIDRDSSKRYAKRLGLCSRYNV